MNSSYTQNFKNIQTSPRFLQQQRNFQYQKPKPRQSQPPMMSQDSDFAVEYTKSPKDQLNQSNNNPRNYRIMQNLKLQANSRNNLNNLNSFQSETLQRNFDFNKDNNNNLPNQKTFQQMSSRDQIANWSAGKYNNRNIAISPTAQQNQSLIQKKFLPKPQLNSYKNTNFQNSISPKNQFPLQKTQGFNNFSYKKLGIEQPVKNTNIVKKAPRFSEPGFLSFGSQQQNSTDYNQSKYKNQQDTISKSSRIIPENQSIKYGSKYGNNYSENKLSQNNQSPIKNEFLKKQKQLKQNVSNQISQSSNKTKLNPKNLFKISDFQRGKQLGNGKFGSVCVVKHKKTGFICAMKSIPKYIIKQENIINQFIRQIKIQTYLDHPNITKLYGFFEDSENIYLLLQLSSQGQLYELLKQKKKLTQKTVIYLIKQLCQAIKYLHNQNIIHRDIKPQNIVLQYGTIKLCDFGWAVCRGGQLRSTFCGTPLYVSPEILKGQMYDEKIDIWSIGILTYQLLIGEIPFQINTQQQLIKIIKQDIVFPTNVNVSGVAKDFILKILKKNPDQRLKIGKLLQHPFLQEQIQISDIQL